MIAAEPTSRDQFVALLAALVLGGLFVAVWQMRSAPLPELRWFLPALGVATEATVAGVLALVARRFRVSHTVASGLLTATYAYMALILPFYYLTIPGVFLAHGLPGTRYTSPAWVFTGWHLFPSLLFLCYANERRLTRGVVPAHRMPGMIWRVPLAAGFLAALTLAGAFWGDNLLVLAVPGDPQSYLHSGMGLVVLIADFCAWAALTKVGAGRTVAELWLSFMSFGIMVDSGLGIFAGGRHTLGFYSARASFELVNLAFLAVLFLGRKDIPEVLIAAPGPEPPLGA